MEGFMASEQRRTVLVTGATGAQGGSVARYLLDRGQFAVRCLTRNPDSDKARALQQAGAEVVAGDLDSSASLRAALDGCWGVFGLTNFWEHFGKEYEQGKNLIDAVAESGAEQFVLSTLPGYHKLSGGALAVPHCDIKAQLEDYTRERGLPATFVHVAFYYENFLTYFPPQAQKDGTFAFGFPQGDTPLAAYSVEDTGGIVAPLFERPDEFQGRTIGVVGDDRSCAEYAEIMTRVLNKPVAYNYIPREVFASFGFPGAEELANMFEVQRLHIPERKADLEESRRLYPGVRSFEQWLTTNKDRFAGILGS
jgi:uncharacterized protein YbjT (DUF2867 family)